MTWVDQAKHCPWDNNAVLYCWREPDFPHRGIHHTFSCHQNQELLYWLGNKSHPYPRLHSSYSLLMTKNLFPLDNNGNYHRNPSLIFHLIGIDHTLFYRLGLLKSHHWGNTYHPRPRLRNIWILCLNNLVPWDNKP